MTATKPAPNQAQIMHPTGAPITEYGINFPNGTEAWGTEEPPVPPLLSLFYKIDLSTKEGRGKAQDTYNNQLRSIGINPEDIAPLIFLTRTKQYFVTNGKSVQ